MPSLLKLTTTTEKNHHVFKLKHTPPLYSGTFFFLLLETSEFIYKIYFGISKETRERKISKEFFFLRAICTGCFVSLQAYYKRKFSVFRGTSYLLHVYTINALKAFLECIKTFVMTKNACSNNFQFFT